MSVSIRFPGAGQCEMVLAGKIGFDEYGEFNEVMDKLDAGELSTVSLDVRKVEMLDSAALGMFSLMADKCRDHDASFTVSEAEGLVGKMLRAAKLVGVVGSDAA